MAERVRLKIKRVQLKTAHETYIASQGKCTHRMVESFKDLLLRGLPIDKCCDFAGISHQSYYNWMSWGYKYLESGTPKHHEVYGIFFREIKKSAAEYQLTILDRSMNHPGYKPAWIRDMTLLERKDRTNWGRSDLGKPDSGSYDPDEKFL